MKIKHIPARKENFGGKRALRDIRYIVVHYTANKMDKAVNNGEYFAKHITKSSAHYFVDENEVIQSVKDDYIAYSVGGSKYKNTGGGSLYGICKNANSISVELCDSYYGVPQKTAERAAELIRGLMHKYNVSIENVIRHYDVTGKICPRPFAEDESLWNDFKKRLERIDMEELNALKKRVTEIEKANKVYDTLDEMPKWIRDIAEWGLENGIITGTGDGLGMTRTKAETLVMIKNAMSK